MTISTTTNKVRIAGNGITTSFQFKFPLLKNDYSDLRVYIIDIDSNTQTETSTLLNITANYTLAVSKNTEQRIIGGYINLIDSNNNPLALTKNQALFIKRVETLTQDTDLSEGDKFPYQVLENSLDKLTIITQQQQEEINRTLKLSSYTQSELSEEFETPIESKGLMWGKDNNNKFYIKNTQQNPDTIYNDIVKNKNVIAVGNDLNGTNNIEKVANNESNINEVNSNKININIVATNINNVNLVAYNINNLNEKADKDLNNITTTGKELISNISMPSNKYIDLTISVGTDTTFTAPANGYYSARTGNIAGLIQILKPLNGTNTVLYSSSNFSLAVYNSMIIPIMKNEKVIITIGGSIDFCRFIYANDN